MARLTEQQGPEMTDRFGAGCPPTHCGPLEPAAEDRLARRFPAPRPDRPARLPIPRVVPPRTVRREVLDQPAGVLHHRGVAAGEIPAAAGRPERRCPLGLP